MEFSKESSILIAVFLLLSFFAVVVLGTIYPIISEIFTGSRFNIQAPYFNAFAPYFGFSMALLIGLSQLITYRRSCPKKGLRTFVSLACWAFIPSMMFCAKADILKSQGSLLGIQVVGIWISFLTIFCIFYELFKRIKKLKYSFKLLFFRDQSFLGSVFAHVGLIAGLIGFLGNYRGLEKVVTLEVGESTSLYGYNFKLGALVVERQDNMHLFKAPLEVVKDGEKLYKLYPARAKYPTKDDFIHEVDYSSNFWHDVYISLLDFDRQTGKQATLELHINPTVKIVWLSGFLMIIGGIISMLGKGRFRFEEDMGV